VRRWRHRIPLTAQLLQLSRLSGAEIPLPANPLEHRMHGIGWVDALQVRCADHLIGQDYCPPTIGVIAEATKQGVQTYPTCRLEHDGIRNATYMCVDIAGPGGTQGRYS